MDVYEGTIRFIATRRGKAAVLFRGRRYYNVRALGRKVYWRCCMRSCSATLVTADGVLTKVGEDHNHGADNSHQCAVSMSPVSPSLCLATPNRGDPVLENLADLHNFTSSSVKHENSDNSDFLGRSLFDRSTEDLCHFKLQEYSEKKTTMISHANVFQQSLTSNNSVVSRMCGRSSKPSGHLEQCINNTTQSKSSKCHRDLAHASSSTSSDNEHSGGLKCVDNSRGKVDVGNECVENHRNSSMKILSSSYTMSSAERNLSNHGEKAQQIRHGQMQMSGGAVRHPGPSPQFQQRPRMSAPSATVTSAPPLKRPRMDAPPPSRSQMTGNRSMMQRSAMDVDRKPRIQMPPPPPQQLRPPQRQFQQQSQGPPPPPRVQRQAPRSTMRSPQHQTSAEEVTQSPELSERSFRNPDHSSHIMTQLSALWKSGRFVDAAILVGEVKLQAHRMVLFAASPYLRASFDNLNPSTELRLKMPSDIKLDVVFQFLTYLYDGVLRLNTDNAAPLLKVSLMLRMEHLAMCCKEFMAQAVKQGMMPPMTRDDVVPPLLVLVDHHPPDTGGSKMDMCTQTTSSGSEQELPPTRPCVEFERVFGEEDRGRAHGATQFNGSAENIQSDVDVYKNYEEEATSLRGGEGAGMKAVHTQNDDDDDAMPMMIIKNEHIDPGYELSLNPQHSDSENEDDVSQSSQELAHPEQTSPTAHSNSDLDRSTDPVTTVTAGEVPEESVPNTDPGDSVAADGVLPSEKNAKIRSRSSSHTLESVDQDLTSQSDSKSASKDDNVSSEIGNDSRTSRMDELSVDASRTSDGTESASKDDSAVFKHSDQSLPIGQSCDQSPPQFGTEEFLTSDFDSPAPHPAKTEPEEPA